MKIAVRFALLSMIVASGLFAQTGSKSRAIRPAEIFISPALAEQLIVQKAELTCPHVAMPARVTCTVVVSILIGKTGDVLYPKVISGPAMLRGPVLNAVRKYKYKPYIRNLKPVEVQTAVSVAVDSYRDCRY